ncbi:MAG: hypothetical protein K2P78_08970 [Gemmataceae bacterium]|nr:hypothetical protein [Gemmataceae bacterium]
MTAKHPEFRLPDESVLRAHAHCIGNTGSGKRDWLVASLTLHPLVIAEEMTKNPHKAVPCYLLIDQFRPVSPPPRPEDTDRPR